MQVEKNIICPDCNGKKDYRAKSCLKCKNKLRPPRKGTGVDKRIGTNGYIYIMINGKEISEHRHIMQQILGRKLNRNEHVHHKNGIKTDNNIHNLILLSSNEHHKSHLTSDIAKEMSKLGHMARWGYYVSNV